MLRARLAPVGKIASAVAAVLIALAVLAAVSAPARAIRHSSTVAALVKAVPADHGAQLRQTLEELSGEIPATIGGAPYTIHTRLSDSGTPIEMAEQYVYEHLLGLGLDSVTYQPYGGDVPGRNVVAEIRGTTRPQEIVVVCGHLDDMCGTKDDAPGADDNGSSCAALLWMARHFAGHHFARTIRFVFFDGEERGDDGSFHFATTAHDAGEDLVAVVNADMIGWNGEGSHIVELNTRKLDSDAAQADLWAALQYVAATRVYGIAGITPRVLSLSPDWSDHWAFWQEGYPAVCLIEDELAVHNPYYHTPNDTLENMTWPYYLHVTEGFVATAAHLAYIGDTLPSSRIYVSGLALHGVTSAGRRGVRAMVRVRDVSFTTVLGATVSGRFTGATSATVSGVTDAGGRVWFSSPTRPRGGVWRFRVTGVSKSGWSYAAALDPHSWVRLRYPR